MILKDLTLVELLKERPDLIEAAVAEAAKKAAPAAGVGEMQKLREELQGKIVTLSATIDTLRTDLTESKKRLDESQVREKVAAKEAIIAEALKEAALPAEHVTPIFMSTLRSVVEREVVDDKGAKRVVTVAEGVRAHIEDRKKLITPVLGAPAGGAGTVKKDTPVNEGAAELTEDERHFVWEREFAGKHEGVTIVEYRKDRDEKKAAAAAKK